MGSWSGPANSHSNAVRRQTDRVFDQRRFEKLVNFRIGKSCVGPFVRIHQTIRTTPAMAAGVTKRLWEMTDIVDMLEAWEAAEWVLCEDYSAHWRMSIRRVLVYRYGSVLRIGGERRTFHVAFTSSSSTAKIALVAPILGQLQKEFSWSVRWAGPFVCSSFDSRCLHLAVVSYHFGHLLERPSRALFKVTHYPLLRCFGHAR
jgi:hypothetical protein